MLENRIYVGWLGRGVGLNVWERELYGVYKDFNFGCEKRSVVMNRLCERGFSLIESNSMLY